MSEAMTFWMDNKNCVGKLSAVIGEQSLVSYRDRYYLLQGGAALTKGGKPLRYSPSSLPTAWKRALKGEMQLPEAVQPIFDSASDPKPFKQVRKKVEKPVMSELKQESAVEQIDISPSPKTESPKTKSPKKSEARSAAQPPIVANCPYCNTHHEIPLEKGKGGKPFFMACSKCQSEFAVRLVPVTIYQAQVAGFR